MKLSAGISKLFPTRTVSGEGRGLGVGASAAPLLVSTLLASAILANALSIVRSLLPSSHADATAPMPIVRHPASMRRLSDTSTIVNAHLFGLASAPAGADAEAPPSHNALSLRATFAMSDPNHGYAIIVDAGQTGVLYAPGARVGAGAVLQRVYSDYVILNRGGALEKLELREKAGKSPGMPAGAGAPIRVAAIPPAGEPPPNPSPVIHLQTISLMPVFGDASRGARISMPSNPTEFKKTGLRPGDIITAVNGAPVHSAQAAADQLKATNGGAVNVTIQRGAQTETIQVESLE